MTFNNGTTTLGTNSVFVINGGQLRINGNATVNGTNVMFYLTNGATLQLNGGATIRVNCGGTGVKTATVPKGVILVE